MASSPEPTQIGEIAKSRHREPQIETTRQSLIIKFYDGDYPGGVQILNCTRWLSVPKLSQPIAEAFVGTCSVMTGRSRFVEMKNLSDGLFAFAKTLENGRELTLNNLSTTFFNQLIAFVGRKHRDGTYVSSASVRVHHLGVVRKLLEWFKSHTRYSKELPSDCDIRRNPWPRASRQYAPTELLDDDTWNRLYRIVTEEVSATIRRVEEEREALSTGSKKLASTGRKFLRLDGLDLALAYARESGEDIKALGSIENPRLRRFVSKYGFRRFVQVFYPTASSLIAFVYTLAMHTLFNRQQMMDLNLSDITYEDLLGSKRIVFLPRKKRAGGRKQRRSFHVTNENDNPARIVEFMRDWTKELRPLISPKVRDRLFIFASRSREDEFSPASFENNKHGFSHHFVNSAGTFFRNHGLPVIGFRQIRYTGLDIVHSIFGGDLRAVQAIGNQRSRQTIADHYTSAAARRRNDARLASAMNLRARYINSKGAIDPRRLPANSDRGAATPGWGCMDCYDSPMPGEIKGRTCGAYGKCPLCPLSFLDLRSSYSLARLIQLEQEIEKARTYLGASRWLAAWAPVRQEVRVYWLPLFVDEAVISDAQKLHLDDLPELE